MVRIKTAKSFLFAYFRDCERKKKIWLRPFRIHLLSWCIRSLEASLKRFNAENKKINDHIIFEETFDLRAYMDDRYVGGDMLEYHLIGVVVHEGSVDTGHCFAYVRGDKSGGSEEDNKDFTYCLDELVVREVSYNRNSSVKQGLSYAKTSSAFGPPATPSGYGNRSEPGLAKYRVASIRTSASQIHTPISNHASSKQRHPRSRSTTYESGKQVSSERPWKSPDESSYSSWR
ncbi:hypothetical protein C5167_044530 [Papaver somniferum]|uniref:ubiquitinyl hydrolase 1 n=1 Tax=Papaver somniferum TaxID=3469 RepID=A0A4Y7L8X9_PAPSO|nr:hypothetical protein C5167_044530 [Papaver somniferum]